MSLAGTRVENNVITLRNIAIFLLLNILLSRSYFQESLFYRDSPLKLSRYLSRISWQKYATICISKLRNYNYRDKPTIILVPVTASVLCDDSGTGVN